MVGLRIVSGDVSMCAAKGYCPGIRDIEAGSVMVFEGPVSGKTTYQAES